MNDRLLALWKRLLSYKKKDWTLKDYPLRYKQKSTTANPGIDSRSWSVQIIHWWWLVGLGDTKALAFDSLSEAFSTYKKNQAVLPRPGTIVPLQIAATTELEQLEDIAVHFFPAVLGYDFHGILVTDESSVFDFGVDEKPILETIYTLYHLQLNELGDGNIVRILKAIKANGSLTSKR